MKKIGVICVAALVAVLAMASCSSKAKSSASRDKNVYLYDEVDVAPAFLGAPELAGISKFQDWVYDAAIRMTSYASYSRAFFGETDFIVTKEGKVERVTIVPSPRMSSKRDALLNKYSSVEELDKVKHAILSSEWTPGMLDGKPVDVLMTVKLITAVGRENLDKHGNIQSDRSKID